MGMTYITQQTIAMMTPAIPWRQLVILDADARTRVRDEATIRHALEEYRRTGQLIGLYLRRVGEPREEPAEPSTWGPDPSECPRRPAGRKRGRETWESSTQ